MRVRPPKEVPENHESTSVFGVEKNNAIFLKSTGEGFSFDHVFGEVSGGQDFANIVRMLQSAKFCFRPKFLLLQ